MIVKAKQQRQCQGFPDPHTLAIWMVPGSRLTLTLPDDSKLVIELDRIENNCAGLYVHADGLVWESARPLQSPWTRLPSGRSLSG